MSVVIAGLAGLAIVVVGAVVLATLIRQRPVDGLGYLLIAGIPLLAGGQLWTIGLMRVRQGPRPRGAKAWLRQGVDNQIAGLRSPRRLFFGGLTPRIGRTLLAIALAGWVCAFTSVSSLNQGGPTNGVPGCPYRLSNHGSYECVSREVFNHVGASVQRFGAGVLLAFFCLHFGAALGHLQERRATQRSAGN